ncbi:MAG: hypothetical protein CMN30_25950 [Sandaracinus sp.]|nr:hypothetical protein [Sandaracinus sp.]|tara:strand:- start:782 stop:1006 length:225 start_codon:yes stop_codon:yes gene_type:complete
MQNTSLPTRALRPFLALALVAFGGCGDDGVSSEEDARGQIQDDGAGGIERVPGTIRVTGTASSDYGTYDVDLTL